MIADFTILVGTVGRGLSVSRDGGKTWRRPTPMVADSRVYEVHADPTNPSVVYAGTDNGICKSEDGGVTFRQMDNVLNDQWVWRIAVDPVDPDIVYAGTKPPCLYRSRDGARTFEKLDCPWNPVFPLTGPDRIPEINRVTGLAVDPIDHNMVWACVEADGIRRSTDGGDTWVDVSPNLPGDMSFDYVDMHDVAVSASPRKGVILNRNNEILISNDEGETWNPSGAGVDNWSLPFLRNVTLADMGKTIFVGTGDDATGYEGGIRRSRDRGESWEDLELPIEPNTPIYGLATHPMLPGLVAAGSRHGQIFVSRDNGDWWVKSKREFSELRRGMAILPS